MSLVENQRNLEILGQRLHEIRELRGMSPLKLAAEIDGGQASIYDWEKGSRNIQSTTIRRLAQALDLSYPEEMYWYGLAGHLPKTRLPAKSQIIKALEAYYVDLAKLPFPAQIIDHRMTYWVVNPATIDFLGSRDRLVQHMSEPLTALSVIFDSDIGFFERVSQPQQILNRQKQLTRRIVGRSIHRRHENFYHNFPKEMQYSLSPDDFRQFITVWKEANSVEQNELPHLDDDIMMRYFDFQYLDGRTRKLQMRTDHLRHFGDIFEITLFHPSEAEDENRYRPQAKEGVKLWEIMNVDHLLRQYDSEFDV